MVIKSQYARQAEGSEDFGSKIIFEKGLKFKFYGGYGERKAGNTELCDFTQELKPPLKLIIIGAEHDAVQLSSLAGSCGWQVKVIVPSSDPGKPEDFPGSDEVIHSAPEFFEPGQVDRHTAVMLMTHSYVMDLKYLMKFTVSSPKYLGLLGPSVRKEKLFDELLMEFPEIDDAFFDTIYGPAGINIGAETPREIAVSIVGEILSVFRGQDPMPLKEKKGRIHSGIKL